MKRILFRMIVLCLTLALLAGCAGTADRASAGDTPDVPAPAEDFTATVPAGSQPPAESAAPPAEASVPEGFGDTVEAQAYAAALAGWFAGEETLSDPDRTLLCWEMAGWYAARERRISGYDLIPAAQIEDFLRSVGYTGEYALPEDWAEYGMAERYTTPGGEAYYAFIRHYREFDEMLGVTTEVALTPLADMGAEGTVTVHYDNGLSESGTSTMAFEPNPEEGSAFAFRMTQFTAPDDEANMVGDLTFTWEELTEANRLRNVLSIYPTVRHYNKEYGEGEMTWIYPRGDGLTILSIMDGYISGYFNGAYFTWQERENGRFLASIEDLDPGYTDPEAKDGYLTDYLSGIAEMRYESTEGDLIWTECTVRGGMLERVAVDRGTLVLREIQVFYAEDYPPSTTVFLYNETGPALECLDSWDGPMRTVTVHWEEFPDGVRTTRDETVRIPVDWEYLPWQGRWGGYTAWMNADYTRLYEYPGDGMDYTLYLTTAKG